MWFWAVLYIAVFAIAYATLPKPKAPAIGTFEAPTAEEGRSIPVFWGTRELGQANVVWYGDIETEAVKKKGGKK